MPFQTGGEIKEEQAPFQSGGEVEPQPNIGFEEGQELPSRQLTFEEVQEAERVKFEDEFLEARLDRSKGTNDILKLQRGARVGALRKLPTLHLLEAVSDIDSLKNFAERRQAVRELENRGVPLSTIEEFVTLERGPTGLKGLLKKEAIPTGAEIAGGVIGQRVGKPIRGAVIGRGIGEAIQRTGERVFVTERQKSLKEDITGASINTALSGLGEWAAGSVFKVAARALKPAGATRKFGIEASQEALTKAGKKVTAADVPADVGELVKIAKGGVGLASPPVIPPGSATNSALFGTLDNISEKAVTSMQRFRAGKANNIVAFSKHTDTVLDEFASGLTDSLSPSQLGGVLDDVIQGKGGAAEAARDIYRQFYGDLDTLTKSAIVDVTEDVAVPTGLLDEAGSPITRTIQKKVGERVENGVSNTKTKAIAQEIVDLVDKKRILKGADEGAAFIKQVADLADNSTFSESITNRSQIFDLARRFEASGEKNAARLADKLGQSIDTSMEAAAKKAGPDAHKIWRRGNSTFKGVKKRFEAKVITKLAKDVADSPELAAKTIFKNGEPTRILKVKKVLLSPAGKNASQIAEGRQTWQQLQNALVNNMFDNARSTDKIVFGSSLENAMKKLGPEALEATFSPQQIKGLEEVATLGKRVQGKIKGEGGMLIQLAQPAAFAGAVAGKGKGRLASIAVLTAPPVWARLALNPTTNRLLINGLADIDKFGARATTSATKALVKAYFKERESYLDEQTELERRTAKERQQELADQTPSFEQLRGFGGRGL